MATLAWLGLTLLFSVAAKSDPGLARVDNENCTYMKDVEDCGGVENAACLAVAALFNQFYNATAYNWGNVGYWHQANMVESVMNYLILCQTQPTAKWCDANVTNTWLNQTLAVAYAMGGMPIPQDEGYDDSQWWALAQVRISEYMWGVQNGTGRDTADYYFSTASAIWTWTFQNSWTLATCSGGMEWDRAQSYKNAITNELATVTPCKLYGHYPNAVLLEQCEQVFNWFYTGQRMLNTSSGLYNDGLDSNCDRNNGTEWSYNQGVILGGLVQMYRVSGDVSYIDDIVALFGSIKQHMTTPWEYGADVVIGINGDGSILRELVNASMVRSSTDRSQFKGILMRYLGYALGEMMSDSSLADVYEDAIEEMRQFVLTQSKALARNAADPKCTDSYDPVWYEHYAGRTVISQAAAVDALNTLWLVQQLEVLT